VDEDFFCSCHSENNLLKVISQKSAITRLQT
jgi:hypothetical protein